MNIIDRSSSAAAPRSGYNLLEIRKTKKFENWSFRWKPSSLLKLFLMCFLYLSLQLSMIHWPEKNSILKWQLKVRLAKFAKTIQLSPAEVAYRFAYIDSSWVKESKYNSNVMPVFASPLNLPSLSLWPPIGHVPERCK